MEAVVGLGIAISLLLGTPQERPMVILPAGTPYSFGPTNVCVDSGGGGTAGLQPRMVPSSVANRKRAGPEFVPSLITKPVLPESKTV